MQDALSSQHGKHATIGDIATRAGVAPMTVSRVMNAKGYVSESLKEKVLAAALELDYSPNWHARSLKGTRTKVIWILLPDIANPFAAEFAHGIQEGLLA